MTQGSNVFGGKGRPAPEFLRYLAHKDMHLDEARNDPNCFMEYCFEDQAGKSFRQTRMHREWQAAFTKQKRAFIAAPRNHGKSQQLVIGRVLYELGRDTSHIFKIVGANDEQARKRVKAMRRHMESNDLLHAVFPVLKHSKRRGGARPKNVRYDDGEWNLGSLSILGRGLSTIDPSIQAKSILASISGDRATHMVFDDAADRRNSVELPRQRNRIVEGIDDFLNVLHPDIGRAWGIGTLWHHADLHHYFMRVWPTYWYEITKKLGSFIRFPNGKTRKSDHPLWPERLGLKQLKIILKEQGWRKFLRGYGNRPMANEEQHIKPEWIDYYTDATPREWPFGLSVDVAESKRATANWTAYVFNRIHPAVIAGIQPPSLRGALRTFKAYHRRQTSPEKVQHIEQIYLQGVSLGIKWDHIAIESAGGGEGVIEHLYANGKIPRSVIQPVRPDKSKTGRVDRVSHFVENKTNLFHRSLMPEPGGSDIASDEGSVIGELVSMPLAEFDDLADAWSQEIWVSIKKYPALNVGAALGFQGVGSEFWAG